MKMLDFTDICDTFGVKVKPENTIVEKWPTRLRLRPGDKGAEEEFWLLFGSDFNNVERYVEWRRATLT